MTAPDLSPEAVERALAWLEHDPRRLTESNIAALLRALSARRTSDCGSDTSPPMRHGARQSFAEYKNWRPSDRFHPGAAA